jgi:Ca-activated chloride channel family protein
MTGAFNGGKKTFEYGAAMAKESKQADFIPRLWAIRKVGYLLEEIRLHGERPELKDEVTMLGKKFGIVTPYTSYLVVEDVPVPVAQNRPMPRDGWRGNDMAPPPPTASSPAPWGAPAREESARFAPMKKEAKVAPEPAEKPKSGLAHAEQQPAAPMMDSDDFARAFGGSGGVGNKGAGQGALGATSGDEGIAVSKATRALKDSERGPGASDPVRVAGGRTYIFKAGGWIDSEALSGTAKQLKVKYLSDAYFALLKARPELKAGIALGDRVVVIVGAGKSVVIAPNEGEEKADKVEAFLK